MNSPQKGFAPIIIIIILITMLGLGGAWFLYQENRSLATLRSDLQSKLADRDANIDKLKNEKAKSAEELAVLKASDIAKEVEFSRLKLKNLETDLGAAGVRVTALEPVMIKIRLYADAVAAIDQNLAPPWTTPLY